MTNVYYKQQYDARRAIISRVSGFLGTRLVSALYPSFFDSRTYIRVYLYRRNRTP